MSASGSTTFLSTLRPFAARRNARSHLSGISLANVLAGDTCSPISLSDFEAYLVFQEHSPENLQFVVWYQDYRKRFFELPAARQSLSATRFSFSSAALSPVDIEKRASRSRSASRAQLSSIGTVYTAASSPPSPQTPTTPSMPLLPPTAQESESKEADITAVVHDELLRDNIDVDAERWPLRTECLRAIATFLQPGSPKELSLDATVRDTAVREAMLSCHPDVFHAVYQEAYDTLEKISLPRFLSNSTTNINRPRQLLWYASGSSLILFGIGLAAALILTIPTPPNNRRAWRLLAVVPVWYGFLQLYSAYRGFCSQVWKRGSTQLRVWEMEDLDDDARGFIRDVLADAFPPKLSLGHVCNRPDGRPFAREGNAVPIVPGKNGSGNGQSIDTIDEEDSEQSESEKEGSREPRRSGGHVEFSTNDNDKPRRTSVGRGAAHTMHDWTAAAARQNVRALQNGFKRPPIFGPERAVLDPTIKRIHTEVLWDIVHMGFWVSVVFSAIIFPLPGYQVYMR